MACSTTADCPACPALGGAAPYPCGRLCEPRQLKFYVTAGGALSSIQVTDLFLDPDEQGLHRNSPGTVTHSMSNLLGPYGDAMRRANCCVDDWWPEVAALGTLCDGGYSCPADLTCNE